MIKVSSKPLFKLNYSLVIGVVVVYLINNLVLKKNFESILLKNHLNDFLFMILVNSICFILLKTMYSRKTHWLGLFLLNYIIVSTSFEFILPNFDSSTIADFYDLISYFCGLVFYLILFKIYDTNNLLQIRR